MSAGGSVRWGGCDALEAPHALGPLLEFLGRRITRPAAVTDPTAAR